MPPSASNISPLTASTALRTPLPPITRLVAVAQFDRLVRAGRGAGWNGGASARAVLQNDVDLDGRIAAAIEDFAANNVCNGGHGVSGIGTGLLQDRQPSCHAPSRPCIHWCTDDAENANGTETVATRPARARSRPHPTRPSLIACRTRMPGQIMWRDLLRRNSPHSAPSPANLISRIWSSITCPLAFLSNRSR